MGKHAKLKEKQKWSNEKLHLENARKLRGIYSLTRRIRNSKKPSRMLVRNWKHQWLPLCLVKIMKKNCGSGGSNKIKTRLACFLEASESTRLRMGESFPTYHEDQYCRKRRQITATLQVGTQIFPMPQSYENSRSKGCSGQGIGKIGENFGMKSDKSQK